MKLYSLEFTICAILLSASVTGRAASSAPAFYGDPPDAHHAWAVHDGNRPQPKEVTPGTFSSQEQAGQPPSDAIVLFNGTDLSNWESVNDGSPAKWLAKDGILEVVPKTGDIRTKEQFGDCQLHIEWAEPSDVSGSSQGRGNSGVFLMGRVEIQVLDSYHNLTYADGGAAAVYGVHPPLANAVRPPGQFQVYDIIFRRPIYKDGQAVDPGYVTVFVNGVVAQDHALLEGPTGHMRRSKPSPFPEKGPLALQDHGNPVRFRNIWYRPLPPRVVEGGTDGWLPTEAAMAKRKQIAAAIREDAAHLQNPADPVPQMLRLMESLVYDKEQATFQEVEQAAMRYVASVRQLPADKLGAREDEVKRVNQAFDYLARFNILPASFEPKLEIGKLIREQRWDKK
jgi:hypothetical protein